MLRPSSADCSSRSRSRLDVAGVSLSYMSDNAEGLQDVQYRTAVLVHRREETSKFGFVTFFSLQCRFENDP
jgi:hypothetical protein